MQAELAFGAMSHRRARARLDVMRATAVLLAVCGCTERKSPGIDAQATETQMAAADGSTTGYEKAARASADAWLALVDAGNNAQSFNEAAALFKGTIDQAGWERAVRGVRDPLGKVISRTLKTAKYSRTLPGAPDGQYVVLKFDTHFEKKPGAIETVTPTQEPDGRWRVSGYFIK
jgi:hypothetical protein